jgi:hypothetical protein
VHKNNIMTKSPAGKEISRMNAYKHGLRATDELFIAQLKEGERTAFQRMRRSLLNEYKPVTDNEKMLVDRIAIQHFRLYRLYSLEASATDMSAEKPLTRESIIPHLDRFSRYDHRIEKQIKILHNRLVSLFLDRRLGYLSSYSNKE